MKNNSSSHINAFCQNYLEKNVIVYKNNSCIDSTVCFTEDNVDFTIYFEDDFIFASAPLSFEIANIDENKKHRLAMYLQECNFLNKSAYFDFFEFEKGMFYIYCGANKHFTSDNMEITLEGTIEEIKKMILSATPEIQKIIEGEYQ